MNRHRTLQLTELQRTVIEFLEANKGTWFSTLEIEEATGYKALVNSLMNLKVKIVLDGYKNMKIYKRKRDTGGRDFEWTLDDR